MILERWDAEEFESTDACIREACDRNCVVCILKGHRKHKPVTPYEELGVILLCRHMVCPIVEDFGGEILKWSDTRAFLVFNDVQAALQCTLACQGVAEKMAQSFPRATVEFSAGIAVGTVIMFDDVGDYYGDAVNVASKLGEDNAQPGEVYFSGRAPDVAVADCVFTPHEDVRISGVVLPCCLCGLEKPSDLQKRIAKLAVGWDLKTRSPGEMIKGCLASVTSPVESEVLELMASPSVWDEDTSPRHRGYECEAVLLCTDLSGFSRLTKKHGILHVLTLIMKQRAVWDKILPEFGGKVVKYEGDDVIAIFFNPFYSLCACIRAHQMLTEANGTRETDYQVRMGIGIALGQTIAVRDVIVGQTWEECEHAGENIAKPGEIVFNDTMKDFITEHNKLNILSKHITDAEDGLFKLENAAQFAPLLYSEFNFEPFTHEEITEEKSL